LARRAYKTCSRALVKTVTLKGISTLETTWDTLTPRFDALFGHHAEK
jgi:hypothetical protein